MQNEIRSFVHFSDTVEEGVFVWYIKDGKPHTSFASLEKPLPWEKVL